MSIFSTQPIIPNHSGLLELPAGSIPNAGSSMASVMKTVESVLLTDPGEPAQQEPIPVEEIAMEAYFLFEARGFEHGHDVEDWLAAEALVRERRNKVISTTEFVADSRN
jgi:hypothetical protein